MSGFVVYATQAALRQAERLGLGVVENEVTAAILAGSVFGQARSGSYSVTTASHAQCGRTGRRPGAGECS